MNIDDLKAKCKELEKNSTLNYYEAMQYFMLERILSRISVSRFNNNFILKGGFLISALFGIESRTTRDVDFTINKFDLNNRTTKKMIREVVELDVKDGVKFLINKVIRIKDKDKYNAYRYELTGIYNGLRIIFDIDITTGDVVTPSALKYPYVSLFDNMKIPIYSYNVETILAEKIETILKRGKYNSRMKDYYDVYIISAQKYNRKRLSDAIRNTFESRKSNSLLKDYKIILRSIINDSKIKQLWRSYVDKNHYVQKISFNDIVKKIEKIIE